MIDHRPSQVIVNSTLIILILAICLAGTAAAQEKPMELRVGHSYGFPGQTGVKLPVYLINRQDSIAGFHIVFLMNRPDLMHFSPVSIETEGTLVENWSVGAGYFGDAPYSVAVTGTADTILPYTHYIEVQDGTTPLFELNIDIDDIPDSLTHSDAAIHINYIPYMFLEFRDIGGSQIGMTGLYIEDTVYLRCLSWQGDECLDWQVVAEPPYDSVEIYSYVNPILDTSYYDIQDGSVSVILCGDVNGDRVVNILDVIAMIRIQLYHYPNPTYISEAADVDNNWTINIMDIIYLVYYLFKGGPAPVCYYNY